LNNTIKGIVKGTVKNGLKLIFRVQIINGDNIPLHGRGIICGNHISAVDGPIIVANTDRDVRFGAKMEAWNNKLFAYILDGFKAIKVDRNNPSLATSLITLREMKSVLENDELLGLFPEGTRHGIAKGEDVKDGASFLSRATKSPVIPVKIVGKCLPFHKMKIIYGNPFIVTDKKEGTNQIMKAIDEIEVPGKTKVYKK
jgi:1-acyl-sn-glycerol-3-phosphate acyltransferase